MSYSADFRWHHIYDKDDVLGWPLKPLSTEYAALGTLLSSWSPDSHTKYWRTRAVIRHLEASGGDASFVGVG